ncbi:hypothetical protein L1887_58144 [Cichorium endivia]|nr:hypothetical protein L1887_58144 [Cichorium endivia]
MHHGGDHERLRVGAHGPAGQEDDDGGEDVTSASAAEPDAEGASCPPEHAHERVLQVLVRPWPTVVLGEGVDDTPEHDNPRVEPLLALAATLEPVAAGLHHDDEDGGVSLKSRAHDVVRQTLAEVATKAPRLEGGHAKHHLDPADDGEALAEQAVDGDERRADPLFRTPLEMELEVDAEESLGCEIEDEQRGHGAVCCVRELTTAVAVSEEVAADGEREGCGCEGHVQAVAHEAEHHGERKEEEPCERLYADVNPEDAVDGDRVVCGTMSVMPVGARCGNAGHQDARDEHLHVGGRGRRWERPGFRKPCHTRTRCHFPQSRVEGCQSSDGGSQKAAKKAQFVGLSVGPIRFCMPKGPLAVDLSCRPRIGHPENVLPRERFLESNTQSQLRSHMR